MKLYAFVLGVGLLPAVGLCQKTVTPGSSDINTNYIKPEKSLYTVYYVKDNTWDKQGSLTYDIYRSGQQSAHLNQYLCSERQCLDFDPHYDCRRKNTSVHQLF